MKLVNKLDSLYRREVVTKPKKRFQLIAILFLFNLLVFGYFGIFVGIKSFNQKRALKKEYQTALKNIKSNIDKVDLFEPFIKKDTRVAFVHNAITSETQIDEYLESFVKVSSQQGFVVEKFTVSSLETNNINISAQLAGNISDVVRLLKALESQPRLTVISSVKITQDRHADSIFSIIVNLNLEIFKL